MILEPWLFNKPLLSGFDAKLLVDPWSVWGHAPVRGRQGVAVNWKKLYRLYREERLTARKRDGSKPTVTREGRRRRACG